MKKTLITLILIVGLFSCDKPENEEIDESSSWSNIMGDTAIWNKLFNNDSIYSINVSFYVSLHPHIWITPLDSSQN